MKPEIIWGAAGLILIITDVLFGTFFVLFLGLSALIVGSLAWAGVLNDPLYQWILFSMFSILGVLSFRTRLQKWFGPGTDDKYNEHQGNSVEVVTAFEGSNQGKVKYRGTEWLAVSTGGESFAQGETAVIEKLDGIIIYINKKNT
jgi:membrane protein implicated in regulation of membrane protease activity